MPTIVVHNVFPPIPVRNFDWSAVFDGYDEGDPIGYGATKDEAVRDLLENHPPFCVDCQGRGGIIPGVECATCEGTGERMKDDPLDPLIIREE